MTHEDAVRLAETLDDAERTSVHERWVAIPSIENTDVWIVVKQRGMDDCLEIVEDEPLVVINDEFIYFYLDGYSLFENIPFTTLPRQLV